MEKKFGHLTTNQVSDPSKPSSGLPERSVFSRKSMKKKSNQNRRKLFQKPKRVQEESAGAQAGVKVDDKVIWEEEMMAEKKFTKADLVKLKFKREPDFAKTIERNLQDLAIEAFLVAEFQLEKMNESKTFILALLQKPVFLMRLVFYHLCLVGLSNNPLALSLIFILMEIGYLAFVIVSYIISKQFCHIIIFASKLEQSGFLIAFHVLSFYILTLNLEGSRRVNQSLQMFGIYLVFGFLVSEIAFTLIMVVLGVFKTVEKKKKGIKAKPAIVYKWVKPGVGDEEGGGDSHTPHFSKSSLRRPRGDGLNGASILGKNYKNGPKMRKKKEKVSIIGKVNNREFYKSKRSSGGGRGVEPYQNEEEALDMDGIRNFRQVSGEKLDSNEKSNKIEIDEGFSEEPKFEIKIQKRKKKKKNSGKKKRNIRAKQRKESGNSEIERFENQQDSFEFGDFAENEGDNHNNSRAESPKKALLGSGMGSFQRRFGDVGPKTFRRKKGRNTNKANN